MEEITSNANTPTSMTAQELAQKIYENNPNSAIKLATNANGCCIGAWDEEKGRYVMMASQTILDNQWYRVSPLLLVNGKPLEIDWILIERQQAVGTRQ
jgi:hypothetical protein